MGGKFLYFQKRWTHFCLCQIVATKKLQLMKDCQKPLLGRPSPIQGHLLSFGNDNVQCLYVLVNNVENSKLKKQNKTKRCDNWWLEDFSFLQVENFLIEIQTIKSNRDEIRACRIMHGPLDYKMAIPKYFWISQFGSQTSKPSLTKCYNWTLN